MDQLELIHSSGVLCGRIKKRAKGEIFKSEVKTDTGDEEIARKRI